MWFNYGDENTWHPISTDRVKEILELNKQGKIPDTLTEDRLNIAPAESSINSDLERMDERFKKKDARKKSGNRKKGKGPGQKNQSGKPLAKTQANSNTEPPKAEAQNKGQGQGQGQGQNKRRKNRNFRKKNKPNNDQNS